VVNCLTSKLKALSSNLSTATKQNNISDYGYRSVVESFLWGREERVQGLNLGLCACLTKHSAT
jgi:hypothetical protein